MSGEVLKLKDYQKKIFLMSRWAIAVEFARLLLFTFVFVPVRLRFFPQSDIDSFLMVSWTIPMSLIWWFVIVGQFIALHPFAEMPSQMGVWAKSIATAFWVLFLIGFHTCLAFNGWSKVEYAGDVQDPFMWLFAGCIILAYSYSAITGWRMRLFFPLSLPPSEHPILWKKPKENFNAS